MANFDFLTANEDEIDQYVMGNLIWQSQELAHILVGHLMIEGLLSALIAIRLDRPDRLLEKQNFNFDLKLVMADALGIIPEQHFAAAKALNKIRNQYSHNPDYQISMEDLSPFKFGWVEIQRQAFELAMSKSNAEAVQICMIFLSFSFQALLREMRNQPE